VPTVLLLFDSRGGLTERLAEAVAEGVRSVPGATLHPAVADRVVPHKKVREVEFVDAIPKSLSGKILRRDLIEQKRAKSGG